MSWRAADSVKVLLAEVNALFPGRDKRTDGVISGYPGSVSSHQVNSSGVVCAVDITVGDYPNGITPPQAAVLAESIRHELKVAPRGIYAYVIYDRRMARSTHDWEWEPYKGTSPHTDHIHVSVDWDIPEGGKPSGECPYDMTDTWNLRGPSMVTTTLPTSRPVTQDWNQDFNNLNGVYYPNGFYSSIGWLGHNGIDFGCWEGDPVEAVCDGVIDFVGPGNNHPLLTGGGNAILLRNDALGVKFEYLHLSRFEVSHGQHVKVGQVIARSGNTGISSAPHLHIGAIPIHGVNVNNGYRGRIDPTPYLYGPMNPEFAGSGLSPAGTTTNTEEDIDMAGAADILARLDEIVAWQNKEFLAAADKAERNRNALASFVRDAVVNQSTLTASEIEARFRDITASDKSDLEMWKSADKSEPTVYVYDAATGLRAIEWDEFRALMSAGAILKEIPKAFIDGVKKAGA